MVIASISFYYATNHSSNIALCNGLNIVENYIPVIIEISLLIKNGGTKGEAVIRKY
jgi:hypothetical protein